MIFDPLWVVCYHFYDKVMKDGVHIVPPVITEMIFIQVSLQPFFGTMVVNSP